MSGDSNTIYLFNDFARKTMPYASRIQGSGIPAQLFVGETDNFNDAERGLSSNVYLI